MPTTRSIHSRMLPALAALLMLALAACGGSGGSGGSDGDRTVKVGTLRQPHLFHPDFYQQFMPDGYTIEVVPFANSTEIKNAIVTRSVDFGVTGITAAMQGAAEDEPIRILASAADGGSAIVAGKDTGITEVSDLRGKKLGYVPGSAQDILLRLTLQGAGIDAEDDATLIKLGFADMANAVDRGDIDAFSGAEVGPSDAILRGHTLVTHPYDTPMAKINIIMATSQGLIDDDPDLVELMVGVHAEATDYMKSHKDEWGQAVVDKYGFDSEILDLALENIELRWEVGEDYITQAEVLGAQQELLKQLRKQPDYSTFFDTTFVDELMEG